MINPNHNWQINHWLLVAALLVAHVKKALNIRFQLCCDVFKGPDVHQCSVDTRQVWGNKTTRKWRTEDNSRGIEIGSTEIFSVEELNLRFEACWQVQREVNLQTRPVCSQGSVADGREPAAQMVPVRSDWPRALTLWFGSNQECHLAGKQPDQHKRWSQFTRCLSPSRLASCASGSPLIQLLHMTEARSKGVITLTVGFPQAEKRPCAKESTLVNKSDMTLS